MKVQFLFVVSLLMASTSNAQVSEFLCKKVPKDSFKSAGRVAVGCAKVIPADVLDYLFEEKNQNIGITKFEAKEDNSKNKISVLGTKDYAYYLKLDKNKKVKLQQGQGSGVVAPHCYDYDIVNHDGVRYCNASPPKDSAECLRKWASDPIRNPKGRTKSCEVFLTAMQSCVESDSATEKCIDKVFAKMNVDSSRPTPNPHNKPMPVLEHDLTVESDDEFCGEPDMPPCREYHAPSNQRSGGSR